ncbi:iron-sulfur cluster assembly scaffold protein [Thioalkalivibrio sp. HK1]|uniref:iron-sulfur cluster assembly scaffold protein n=1 Tax=Thioalkalivibrio sp. HK1 TaxID=1469245 RepID=UPI000472266F|nr:iron-sulfur cluster assembly scaffold protein [Thioalkalivibrio sp. HK1]
MISGDLYQAAMIETARRAGGHGRLSRAQASASVDNPLCGDRVIVDIRTETVSSCDPSSPVRLRRIVEVGHDVRGCLLCEAAAVVLAEQAPGCEIESLLGLHRIIESALRSGTAFPWSALDLFSPVAAARSRYRCVTLPFEALHEALMTMDPACLPHDSSRPIDSSR